MATYTAKELLLQTQSIQITSGATDSDIFEVGKNSLVGIVIPVALTGATLTIQGSIDGTNFYTLREKDGTAVAITTATTAGFYKLLPSLSDGVPFIKGVSSSSEGSTRTLTFVSVCYK